jgi:hypothetical protein
MNDTWFDWAVAHFDGVEPATVRILLFFKVRKLHQNVTIGNTPVNTADTYFLYEQLNGEHTIPTHPESVMLISAKLLPGIHCAPTSCIYGPAIVYQDIDFVDRKKLVGIRYTEYFGVIRPRSEWTALFLHRAKHDERQ